jgi:hypothetical protein
MAARLKVAGSAGRALGSKPVSGLVRGRATREPANATTLVIGCGLGSTTDFAVSPAMPPLTRAIADEKTATRQAARNRRGRIKTDLGSTAVIIVSKDNAASVYHS